MFCRAERDILRYSSIVIIRNIFVFSKHFYTFFYKGQPILGPRPGGWVLALAELAGLLLVGFTFALPVPPHFFGLAQRNGVEPQRKTLLGGGAPVRFRDPPASPTRVGGATRPLRCPLRGRIGSLAPGARGLGWMWTGV